MNEITRIINKLASESAGYDDEEFNACDMSGGNYDDAYDLGLDDGEIRLARRLKELLPPRKKENK